MQKRHFQLTTGMCALLFTICSCNKTLFLSSAKHELYRVKIEGKTGYINQRGKIIIPAIYDSCTPGEFCGSTDYFSKNEYCIIRKEGKYGAINARGKVIIEPQYNFLEVRYKRHFRAKSGGKWSLIDNKNKPLFPFIFDSEYFISYDDVSAGKSGNDWYLLYPQSGKMKKTEYEKISPFFEGLAEVRINGKSGFIDSSGKLIIPAVFEETRSFIHGLAAVKINDKWGFTDKTGHIVIPAVYDETYNFEMVYSNKYAVVRVRDKVGLINRKGEYILPPEYESLFFESKNVLKACKGESHNPDCGLIFISRDTSILPTGIHTDFDYYNDYLTFMESTGYGVRRLRSGKQVVPFVFDYLDYFPSGLSGFRFFDKKRNKQVTGYINRKGRIIWVEKGTNKSDIYPPGIKKIKKHH